MKKVAAAAKATRAGMSRALRSLKPSLMSSRAKAKATAAATAMAIHCAGLRAGGAWLASGVGEVRPGQADVPAARVVTAWATDG